MENIYIVKVEKFHFNCIQHLLILILITLKTTSSFIPFSLKLRIKIKFVVPKNTEIIANKVIVAMPFNDIYLNLEFINREQNVTREL